MFYLKDLRMNNNRMHGSTPSELGNLNVLNDLRVGGNDFSGSSIPSEIGNCGSLQYLGLTFSNLGGTIPPELFNATSLKWIHLSNNYLEGTIPPTIGKLKSAQISKSFGIQLISHENVFTHYLVNLSNTFGYSKNE